MSREASPELLARIADRLKALSDPTRLAILHALETRERNVTDLLGELGGSQANLSKHLARMRLAGLLAARRDGTSVYYRVVDQIALCGLTETETRDQNRPVKVTRFPWSASGRAASMGVTKGMTKMIIDPETGRVLGVGIVGREAGEMISEGVLAVEMGTLAEDVALSMHPHPTLSETLTEAAEMFYGHATHVKARKRAAH